MDQPIILSLNHLIKSLCTPFSESQPIDYRRQKQVVILQIWKILKAFSKCMAVECFDDPKPSDPIDESSAHLCISIQNYMTYLKQDNNVKKLLEIFENNQTTQQQLINILQKYNITYNDLLALNNASSDEIDTRVQVMYNKLKQYRPSERPYTTNSLGTLMSLLAFVMVSATNVNAPQNSYRGQTAYENELNQLYKPTAYDNEIYAPSYIHETSQWKNTAIVGSTLQTPLIKPNTFQNQNFDSTLLEETIYNEKEWLEALELITKQNVNFVPNEEIDQYILNVPVRIRNPSGVERYINIENNILSAVTTFISKLTPTGKLIWDNVIMTKILKNGIVFDYSIRGSYALSTGTLCDWVVIGLQSTTNEHIEFRKEQIPFIMYHELSHLFFRPEIIKYWLLQVEAIYPNFFDLTPNQIYNLNINEKDRALLVFYDLNSRIDEAERKGRDLYRINTYMQDPHEYWAIATEIWFGMAERYTGMNSQWFEQNDPNLYSLLYEVYGPPNEEYTFKQVPYTTYNSF